CTARQVAGGDVFAVGTRCRQAARDVAQGHIGNRRVQNFHEGRDYDGDRDQPGTHRRPREWNGHRSAAHGCFSGAGGGAVVGRYGCKSLPASSPVGFSFTRTDGVTDKPINKGTWSGSQSRTSIRTGSRCTTLTKFPVAFSAGKSANVEPVPMVKPEIRPLNCWRLPYMSTSKSTACPMRSLASCVSLKFASTQISVSERIAIRLLPATTLFPGLTLRRVTTPSISANTSQ